jgi:hypothetical protein
MSTPKMQWPFDLQYLTPPTLLLLKTSSYQAISGSEAIHHGITLVTGLQ